MKKHYIKAFTYFAETADDKELREEIDMYQDQILDMLSDNSADDTDVQRKINILTILQDEEIRREKDREKLLLSKQLTLF